MNTVVRSQVTAPAETLGLLCYRDTELSVGYIKHKTTTISARHLIVILDIIPIVLTISLLKGVILDLKKSPFFTENPTYPYMIGCVILCIWVMANVWLSLLYRAALNRY